MALVPPQNSFWVNGNHQNDWTSRICQCAASPSFGPLARVSCWSPLRLRPGDLHAPNSFLFSSHCYFRVWVLLRFNLSSNSVTVHRFVGPQLVSLIIHVQIGCILPCSCLCSSICRQGLAFLARSTENRRSITRGDVVLRLRGLVWQNQPELHHLKCTYPFSEVSKGLIALQTV
jgi:hypothetical protein